MDVERFLVKQGWRKGEGLRPGSIKKPLLVKHRKNNKGLGFNPQASEGWWERVFDGHLKNLGVSGGANVTFSVDEEKLRRDTSPLYASFRTGGLLEGTIKEAENEPTSVKETTKKRHSDKARSAESANKKSSRKKSNSRERSGDEKKDKKHSKKRKHGDP